MVVTYTRSTGVAPNTNMKNVWFGALGRGIYQGRVAVGMRGAWGGVEGSDTASGAGGQPVRNGPRRGGRGEGGVPGRERRAGGKASWGWAAEGAANIIFI